MVFLPESSQEFPTAEERLGEAAFQHYLKTLSETASLEERRSCAERSAQFTSEAISLWNPADAQHPGFNAIYRTEQIWFEFDLLDVAQAYGEFLVAHVSAQQIDEYKHHLVMRLQSGHSILARVALKRNDADVVRYHISKMPIFADYDFRGDAKLPVALFEAGWRESVIDYLTRCLRNLQRVHDLMITDQKFLMKIYQTHSEPDVENWLLLRIEDRIETGKETLKSVQANAPESLSLLQDAF